MEKQISLNQMIEKFIGRRGNMVSGSKSCGPPMAVYNSNMVVGDEVIWHGDINLEESKDNLCAIAELFNITIEIYYEHGVRVFPFEVENEEKLRAEHKKRIAKNKPVWTTTAPNKHNGEDYAKALEQMTEIRNEAIKDRMIYYGTLTPKGTEWGWYNKWWYNGPHKVWRILKRNFRVFIRYPVECVGFRKTTYTEAGECINVKIPIWKQISLFFEFFFREINYHKEEVKKGEIGWVALLFDH